MPQDKKTSGVSPSLNWFQRLMGAEPFTPEMQQGIDIARKEMPNLAPVEPYGFLSRLLTPGAQAYVSPGKSIYLNPRTMSGLSPQDVADTIMHEQTHVKQREGIGPTQSLMNTILGSGEPYHRRPEEIEAFQTEVMRRNKQGRRQTPVPSFTTGNYYIPRDINLPSD